MLTRDNLKLQLIYEQQVIAQPVQQPIQQPIQQPAQQPVPQPAQQPQLKQQFETWGDVKNAVNVIGEILKSKKVKEAGKLFAKIGLSFLPGVAGAGDILQAVLGTAPDVATVLSKIARLPDNKRTNTFIDQLDVDDAISQIVNDDVEREFLKMVQQLIKGHRDDEQLPPNWNMTNELIKFLKQKYAKSPAVQQHLLDLESKMRSNMAKTPVPMPPMQGVNAAPGAYTPPAA
jgi:hypothetical protein